MNPPHSDRAVLVTAAHCIQKDSEGIALPLYAGVSDTLQLPDPLLCVENLNPTMGSDLALFEANEILAAACEDKQPIEINVWPPLDPEVADIVLIAGYPANSMISKTLMSVHVKLHGYPGQVVRISDYVFFCDVDPLPDYAGAVSIVDAMGVSGGPCFIVQGGALKLCGIHLGLGTGRETIEQRLVVLPPADRL